MTAVSVHQIATYLHKLGLNLGKHAGPHDGATGIPTFFFHDYYKNIDQYPNGVADAVGYWVEAEVLDGVSLFDRRQLQEPATGRCESHWPKAPLKRNAPSTSHSLLTIRSLLRSFFHALRARMYTGI